MILIRVLIPIFIILLAIPANSRADDFMVLVATITIERENTQITSMTPIGDFNADGYPDLAVGVSETTYDPLEAVWLYYGGPDFDVEPDLIILGESQNETGLCESWMPTLFGRRVTGLKDFNGDGYDDIAISAFYYCSDLIEEGRIYIYLGSPEPDTVADVIIDGEEPYEELGKGLGSGDFNGDGLGDLLAFSPWETYFTTRAYIHLGNSSPDNNYDWLHYFIERIAYLSWYHSGFDLNDDGFDDFNVFLDNSGHLWENVLFLGNDSLNQNPYYSFDRPFHAVEDISGDGIDDLLFYDSDLRWYLCLGGDSLDFEADYYVGMNGYPLCTYNLGHEGVKLIMDDFMNERFILYNTGIPFDSIPYNIIEHVRPHVYRQADIGDINNDGAEDLAFIITDDTLLQTIEIYSLIATGIDEDHDRLPKDHLVLSCYPNPFNSNTALELRGSDLDDAQIEIYDITGRLVRILKDATGNSGYMIRMIWDGSDQTGRKVSSGIYFARVTISSRQLTEKMIFLK